MYFLEFIAIVSLYRPLVAPEHSIESDLYLVSELDGSINQLPVVPPVQGHALIPEVPEEFR